MKQLKSIPFQIQQLIDALDTKLPSKVVGYKQQPELVLWCCSVRTYPVPVVSKVAHKRKMKLAWLSEGGIGLLNYISPFVRNRKQLAAMRQLILATK